MKIIKEGFGADSWTLRVTCMVTKDEYGFSRDTYNYHCGSILEINKDDLYAKEWFKYPDYIGIDYIVRCPKCGCELVIPHEEIPMNIRANVKIVNK